MNSVLKISCLALLLSIAISQSNAAYSFGTCPQIPVMRTFDTQRYTGVWYEQKRFPSWFERGFNCATAQYGYLNDSAVTVLNSGFPNPGQKVTISGVAIVKSPTAPNMLEVQFPLNLLGFNIYTIKGNYNVIQTDYSTYALVYSCSEVIPMVLKSESAWVLSREKTLSDTINNELINLLVNMRVDVNNFESVPQNCSN